MTLRWPEPASSWPIGLAIHVWKCAVTSAAALAASAHVPYTAGVLRSTSCCVGVSPPSRAGVAAGVTWAAATVL
ncbi:hypothetical protein ACLF6K_09285 [Streptomyces xanthophaeus]|uniref:hypothetical protein n=1 Tax=Streptomyces xanthophaeus TaxID=67385 RepID=UPI00399037A7